MTKLCPRGKAAAKRKFKVYPSAYANAYASKICAGKAKDDRGVRRKDFKGPKPSGGGGTGAAARKIRKASSGGDIKVSKLGSDIDPMLMLKKRLDKAIPPLTKKEKIKLKALDIKDKAKKVIKYGGYRNPKKKSTGGKVKVYKAGKGMLLPMFGLAGMAKYMSMNRKKSGTVAPNKGVVNPVTGKGMDQTNTGNVEEFGKQAVNTMLKNKMGARKGGMKVQKAGLGLMLLMNQMKKEGKRKGRRQAEEGMMQNKQYQDFLASQNKPNPTNMSMGGMVPTATGSYIKQDIDGDESFTNPSTQEYYKDLLD